VRYSQLATAPARIQEKIAPLTPNVTRSQSKLYRSADDAVVDLKSGSTILSAGFGLCGTAGKK
jgi:3-oxoacid CoA-transferase